MAKKTYVGGQAVMEGVMMKAKDYYSIAVRKQKGNIKVKSFKWHSAGKKIKILTWPFIRGILALIEMTSLGIKSITYSANEQATKEEKLTTWEMLVTVGLSFVLALILFKALPLGFAKLTTGITGTSTLLFNIVEGVTKILLFLGYIYIISLMKDVKTLFQYHGAEHKTVNCFEKKLSLTVANVKKQTTLHPRCGTTFILIVLLISIIVYLTIPFNIGFFSSLGLRILLLPVIAGISYELIQILNTLYQRYKGWQYIVGTLLCVQRMTTREPTKKQIEVAIASMKAVLKKAHLA